MFIRSAAVPDKNSAPFHFGGKWDLGAGDVVTAVIYSTSVVVNVGADSRRSNPPDLDESVKESGSLENEEASTTSDSGHVVEGVGLSVNYGLRKFSLEMAVHSQH